MNKVNILSGTSNIWPPQHETDAGFDLSAASPPLIVGELTEYGYRSIDYIEYDTGVKIAPQSPELFSLVFPRSSISKTNLHLANSVGVIDNEYRGPIKVRFKYAPQPSDFLIIDGKITIAVDPAKIYAQGDRIAQLVFAQKEAVQLITTITADVLNFSTNRGEGGFGSTGK